MRRVWALALPLILLSGCVGLPSTGQVQSGLERAPEPEGIVFLAPDPQPGGEPEQIVEGFLDAATAGVADRYETAQKYLTDEARKSWVPGAGVTIYAGNTPPEVSSTRPQNVTVTVPVAGYVDQHGVYTEEAQGAEKTATFTLSQVDGQWRINDLEDGVLISAVNFGTQFRHMSLAFFSPDGRHVIPDPRWFPEQNAPTFAVSALINGPAEWMASGVVSAIPPGTTAEPVNVSEGTAEIALSQDALSASPSEREVVVSQLEHTLTELPQVRRVRTTVDGGTYIEDPSLRPSTQDAGVGHTPIVLTDEGLHTVSGTNYLPIEGIEVDPERNYTALAVPYGDDLTGEDGVAVRVGKRVIETLPVPDQEPVPLFEGKDLLPPVFDPYGWVWSGETTNPGTLLATTPGSGVAAIVDAPLLKDHDVRAVRLSRDGGRIAVLHEVGERVIIQVAMVERDETGTPTGVGEPATVGASIVDASDLAWVDGVTLAVLGSSDGETTTAHMVPLSGPSVALLSVQGSVSLTAGRGEREMWILTDSGELFSRAGNGWRRGAEGQDVHLVAFPG